MRIRDEVKEQTIREKTIQIIVKEGLNGFSIQKLAKSAEVSPATIYIYYKDKEDLIISIGAEIANEMLDQSLENFDPQASFAEGLKIQWKNRAAYFIQNPLEVEFIEQIRYSQLYSKVSEKMSQSFKTAMSQFVCNAIDRKELARLPFEVYWAVAFAPLYQLIKFHTQGKSHVNDEFVLTNKDMDLALELVLKALKP